MIRNYIDDKKIDIDYYFKILSKDIVLYFDKEYENNSKKKIYLPFEHIDKDFIKICEDSRNYLKGKNKLMD